jgi:hypothetical protein
MQGPPGMKGHTLATGRHGIIIYGGMLMPSINMTISDAIYVKKSSYTDICQEIINAAVLKQRKVFPTLPDLTVNDIGSPWWKKMFQRSKNSCFDETKYPAYPEETRNIKYSNSIYFFPTDNCFDNCSGHGGCVLGRCTCNNGYFGDSCQYSNCPNSLVWIDIDTLDGQESIHCSFHGDC